MFTEPYSNGEGYEMELMSDVFIPNLFASVEPQNEIELGDIQIAYTSTESRNVRKY